MSFNKQATQNWVSPVPFVFSKFGDTCLDIHSK